MTLEVEGSLEEEVASTYPGEREAQGLRWKELSASKDRSMANQTDLKLNVVGGDQMMDQSEAAFPGLVDVACLFCHHGAGHLKYDSRGYFYLLDPMGYLGLGQNSDDRS